MSVEQVQARLENARGLHAGEDRGDTAVDFQCRRLATGCLADHNLLNELAHQIDEGLLAVRVDMVAKILQQRLDDPADIVRVDLRAKIGKPIDPSSSVGLAAASSAAISDRVAASLSSMSSSAGSLGRPSAARSLIWRMIDCCSCSAL